MKKQIIIGIAILLWSGVVFGQSLSNLRTYYFNCADTIVLDTFSIVPGSVLLFDDSQALIAPSKYKVFYDESILVPVDSFPKGSKLKIVYRVFPLLFSTTMGGNEFLFSNTSSDSGARYEYVGNDGLLTEDYTDQKIQANGNISRGISAGNGQNMVLNSNLNLQLNGKIDNKISIEAVLSDENVPVQPNGYTQQVNAFDQIYIRLYDSLRYLQMGDVDISSNDGYFLKYQRRLQGADFAGTFSKNSKVTYKAEASAAIAKGTFNRSEFSGYEGVQGPYPLLGVNQERYIVVLAGSERVYIDGVRLTRGENADYIINYNTAELTFTANKMVTKDSRIIVEYEYSDRNYNRFLVSGKSAIKTNKSKVSIQFFSEGDAKNQPVNQSLNDEQKYILSNSGDDPLKAIVPDFDSVSYDKNRILYAIVDTVVQGIVYDSVFRVSFNADSAFYQVGFALVGDNNGNYILSPGAANGKVYTWVAPILGIPQGNYEPIQLLVAPKTQQMFVLSMEQKIGGRTNAGVELALSNKNQNTFSGIDNENNKGLALNSKLDHYFDLPTMQLKSYGAYEVVFKDFNEVERFRSPEFDRDWNISDVYKTDQHLATAGISLQKKKKTLVDLSANYLNQLDFVEGVKLNLSSDLYNRKNAFKSKQSILLSDDLVKRSNFYRHILGYNHEFSFIDAGIKHEMESNKQNAVMSDSLLSISQQFSEVEAYVQMKDSLKRTIGLSYINRLNYLPIRNQFIHASSSNDIVLQTKMEKLKNNSLKFNMTYRRLQVVNEEAIQQFTDEDNLLSRIDHQLRLAKNTFNFSTFYEIGSGLEAKQAFVYVEVAMGQGVYVWVDYNENGIPELDEFEVSKFVEEANYIRIYTPTNDYTKAYNLKMNHTFKISPYRIWRKSAGLKKFVSRFGNTVSIRLLRKQTSTDLSARLNPFEQNIPDTSLLNNRSYFRNTFSFNRSNAKFGANWIFISNMSRSLLVNGFDQSNNQSNQLQLRWNITSSFFIKNSIAVSNKRYSSEFFSNKNYTISGLVNDASIQWQPSPKFRTTFYYQYSNKDNVYGYQQSKVHEVGPEVKINSPGKGSISSKFNIVFAEYNGDVNSSISYEMLSGYVPGQNFKWNIKAAYNINQYLRLSVSYNARKSPDVEVIHTGQASVSAFF